MIFVLCIRLLQRSVRPVEFACERLPVCTADGCALGVIVSVPLQQEDERLLSFDLLVRLIVSSVWMPPARERHL